MNKRFILTKIANYLCAEADRIGTVDIKVVFNSKDKNNTDVAKELKDILHNIILNKETYGFDIYSCELEDEFIDAWGYAHYVFIGKFWLGGRDGVKNYYKLLKNPVIEKHRNEHEIFIFNISWM